MLEKNEPKKTKQWNVTDQEEHDGDADVEEDGVVGGRNDETGDDGQDHPDVLVGREGQDVEDGQVGADVHDVERQPHGHQFEQGPADGRRRLHADDFGRELVLRAQRQAADQHVRQEGHGRDVQVGRVRLVARLHRLLRVVPHRPVLFVVDSLRRHDPEFLSLCPKTMNNAIFLRNTANFHQSIPVAISISCLVHLLDF